MDASGDGVGGSTRAARGLVRDPGLRMLLSLLATFLPQRLKHLVYRRLFGWAVHPTARIGLSVLTGPDFRIGEGVVIGHLNLVRSSGVVRLDPNCAVLFANVINGCEEIHLHERAGVGYHNWISGAPLSRDIFPHCPDRQPRFELGRDSTVVRRHRIDCSDAVTIGEYVVVAGIETAIITHGIDLVSSEMRTGPVVIGDYCHIGTRVLFQPDSVLHDRTAVAPASVVHGKVGAPETLVGGIPAKPIKRIEDGKYFRRKVGLIY